MKACWIAPQKVKNAKNLYFRARSVFYLDTFLSEVSIKISAESFYKVWINGHPAGTGPARGSRRLNFFETIRIRDFLRPGRNVVGVLVHCANTNTNLSYPVCGGALLAEIEGMTWTGDEKWRIRDACDEWHLLEGSSFVMNVGFSEFRDFNQEPVGWMNGEDAESWTEAEILGPAETAIPGKQLMASPVPLPEISTFLPQTIAAVAETRPIAGFENEKVDIHMSSEPHYPADPRLESRLVNLTMAQSAAVTIDPPANGRGVTIMLGFGRETVGFFEMEIEAGERGVIVDVAYDEELYKGRMIRAYRMADRYILREGINAVGTSLLDRGFRFVEISLRNFRVPIRINAVRAVDRRYPVSRRASFFCSDMVLNRVWEISVETLSVCATDVFVDCPWRERAFWINDLIVENLTWLQAMGDFRINAHALRLALSNIRDDGWLPGVNPDYDDPRMVLVPTNLYPPLMLRDYLDHSGDLELVRELLPKALGLLRLFDDLVEESGLVRPPEQFWNFLDWSYDDESLRDPLDARRTSLVEWIRCVSLSAAAELSDQCGDHLQAELLRRKIPAIAKAVLDHLWPDRVDRCSDWLEEDGTPSRHSSQLTHALALLSNTLPEKRKALALAGLTDNSIRIAELYLHHFIFLAMESNGLEEAAVDRVRQYWGSMALTGTPTLWENYVGKRGKEAMPVNIGSLCHGFGSSPIGVLQRILLGVRPLEPGFREFSFTPKSCGVQFANGRVPTPMGDICVQWSVEGGIIDATITIPHGLSAKLADGASLEAGRHEVTIKERLFRERDPDFVEKELQYT